MSDTRAHKTTSGALSGDERRRYMRALLTDLRALEKMLADGTVERGVLRIGAEQEMFLVDDAYHAAPAALELLKRLGPQHFTTELGLFNLEMNADPQMLAGNGLALMEAQLESLYAKVQDVSAELGLQPVLTGILPTITKGDLGIENMVPNPRYLTLNRVLNELRGEPYDVNVKGLDEVSLRHDSIMVESVNASFQVHLQVPEPSQFAHWYNVAQLLLAPVLAVSTNSPTLFGRRLWAETRIALFPQSCDVRRPGHPRQRPSRVSFGNRWCESGVLDIYKENITRFRALVGTDGDENALMTLARGRIPELKALRLHNGTIYPWNRACYGISENGKPHLRIELRALPSGPTIPDEVANAALWLGLMMELVATIESVPPHLAFEHAAANFDSVARDGLSARLTWLDGEETLAQPLVLDKLLPLAEKGLARGGVDEADAKRYLGIIDARVRSMRTGSNWMLHSLSGMKDKGSPGERLNALVAATIARQKSGRVVAEWERARLDEAHAKPTTYSKVSNYMTTDLFTVEADDPVEFVADLMTWERIRYVAVEDAQGMLLGLVTSRAVLRYFAELVRTFVPRAPGSERAVMRPPSSPPRAGSSPPPATGSSPALPRPPASTPALPLAPTAPVSDIMRRELVTVSPDTPTREAIALMRRHRIGCLPVLQGGQIVGMITEEQFMGVAAELLEEKVGEVDPPPPPSRRRG
jgi:CBS domain-containing protein/gamma-glutamylcysteine synthetase